MICLPVSFLYASGFAGISSARFPRARISMCLNNRPFMDTLISGHPVFNSRSSSSSQISGQAGVPGSPGNDAANCSASSTAAGISDILVTLTRMPILMPPFVNKSVTSVSLPYSLAISTGPCVRAGDRSSLRDYHTGFFMRIQSLFQILTLMTAPDSDSRTFIRKRPVQSLPDPVDDDEKTGLDVKVLLFCFIQV